MGEEKHIIYSAADIERYHKKLLSAKEMHALEKAALDDPFLADALEGYAAVPVNAENDIALLREKLNKRGNAETKVIPMKAAGIPWLRVAALVIIIAGAGLLAYRFVFTNQDIAVAKSEESASPEKLSPAATDTNAVNQEQNTNPVTAIRTDTQRKNTTEVDRLSKSEAKESDKLINPSEEGKGIRQDSITISQGVVSAPAKSENTTEKEEAEYKAGSSKKKTKDDIAASREVAAKARTEKPLPVADKEDSKLLKSADSRQLQEQAKVVSAQPYFKSNIFRGQVLDASNTPLPFANVTNTKDNVGTYTDIKGYFTLISPDSSLNVQIRSVGFENANTQLQNNISSNAIVLQQDLKNIPSTTLSNKKVNTERARKSTMVLEEPEPYDGWYNYDTYIANNINLPDDVKQKNTSSGEVELSFDISKSGEPVNIKVEKSACKECDEEAIRLLKEGPKWKKKKKNRRAHLNVAF